MKNWMIFAIFLLLTSCSTQEVCEEDLKAEVIASFYTFDDSILKDTIVSGVNVYGIREGKPDSLLYDSAKVSNVLLPLDPNNENSSFVLMIKDTTNISIDTINIYHSSTVYLVSFTCGFSNNFEISSISYTTHNLKKIELINQDVYAEESDIEEHCKFYF